MEEEEEGAGVEGATGGEEGGVGREGGKGGSGMRGRGRSRVTNPARPVSFPRLPPPLGCAESSSMCFFSSRK